MKDIEDNFSEKKMKMWKMKDEMLNSMGEKELRAFIKGYMMAERMVFKQLSSMCGGDCGCQEGSSCSCKGEGSCGCAEKDCNCGKN